jgi:hypothetical protein
MGHGDDASFRPFTLALIQFGIVLNDKQANLSKARDKIFSAATKKPDLIVLPVRSVSVIRVQTPICLGIVQCSLWSNG